MSNAQAFKIIWKIECIGKMNWKKNWLIESSDFSYGSRWMTKALNALGYGIGRWETRRLMKKSHIFVRYQKKYKLTRNNNHQPLYVTMFYNANLRLISLINRMFLILPMFGLKKAVFVWWLWLTSRKILAIIIRFFGADIIFVAKAFWERLKPPTWIQPCPMKSVSTLWLTASVMFSKWPR